MTFWCKCGPITKAPSPSMMSTLDHTVASICEGGLTITSIHNLSSNPTPVQPLSTISALLVGTSILQIFSLELVDIIKENISHSDLRSHVYFNHVFSPRDAFHLRKRETASSVLEGGLFAMWVEFGGRSWREGSFKGKLEESRI